MTVRASVLASMLALAAVAVGPGITRSSLPAPRGAMDPLETDFTRQDLVMAGNGCGTERWAVKTASDSDRATQPDPRTLYAIAEALDGRVIDLLPPDAS